MIRCIVIIIKINIIMHCIKLLNSKSNSWLTVFIVLIRFVLQNTKLEIVLGLKGCLERLQLDYVDVVFANKSDPRTPMEGTTINSFSVNFIY